MDSQVFVLPKYSPYVQRKAARCLPVQGVKLINPYKALAQLNRHHWLMFWVGFLGWTWDAFDFFTVSLCVTEIAKDFGVKNSDVTWGLTLTLMLRSVGALIFGSMADRYGRKCKSSTGRALLCKDSLRI